MIPNDLVIGFFDIYMRWLVICTGCGFIWLILTHDSGEWNSSRQQPPLPKREPPKGYQPFSKSHLKPLDYNPFSNKATPLGGDENASK